MPLVSKKIPRSEVQTKITETFLEAISNLRTKNDIQLFLSDLLSPVERIMLSKRLAIAVLLVRGHTYESIKDILKVSQETVSKVSLTLNNNKGYKIVINKIQRSESMREFWQDIENIVHRLGSTHDVLAPDSLVKKKLGHRRKTLV